MRKLIQEFIKLSASVSEAETIANVRSFILEAPLKLNEQDLFIEFNFTTAHHEFISLPSCCTLIFASKNLESARSIAIAEQHLFVKLKAQTVETGLRFVGLLTDGRNWRCYHVLGGTLVCVSELTFVATNYDAIKLYKWLSGVLATPGSIPANGQNVRRLLGLDSPCYKLERNTVLTLYHLNNNKPTVMVKRRLWAKLLTSALGSKFKDEDDLFIEHTLIVNTAEIIAHGVLGIDIKNTSPQSLLTGSSFEARGILGAINADFFNWILEVEYGEHFIRTLAYRLD